MLFKGDFHSPWTNSGLRMFPNIFNFINIFFSDFHVVNFDLGNFALLVPVLDLAAFKYLFDSQKKAQLVIFKPK